MQERDVTLPSAMEVHILDGPPADEVRRAQVPRPKSNLGIERAPVLVLKMPLKGTQA